MDVDRELMEYVEKNIFPIYDKVDKAHNVENHIRPVIKDCLVLGSKFQEINFNIIYTVASYHDLGLIKNREQHHRISKEFVLQDENLKKWFSKEQIYMIAEAVEDHRASNEEEPRSIYGEIIADCDRSIDLLEIMYKTKSGLPSKYPQEDFSSFEREFEKAYEWIIAKNSKNGYMRFYIDEKKKQELEDLRNMIHNKEYIKQEYKKLYEKWEK